MTADRPRVGGRRPRAGRKRVLDNLQRRNVYLDQRTIDLIEARQRELGGNFSEALRSLIGQEAAR